jgi:hypothetical protein
MAENVTGRLKADLTRIRQVSRRLTGIKREFSQASVIASGYAAYLGSSQLSGAIDSFANGWSQHRQALIAELAQVASLSDAAATAYESTDDQLAAALRKATGKAAGK